MQDCRAELKREGQRAAMTIVRPWLEARGDDCGLAMLVRPYTKLGPPPNSLNPWDCDTLRISTLKDWSTYASRITREPLARGVPSRR